MNQEDVWTRGFARVRRTARTIHHVWEDVQITLPGKRDHKQCSRCHCEKWFDYAFQTTVYSVKGNLLRRRPECVMHT